MSRRFRFNVLIPIGLVLLALWPFVLLEITNACIYGVYSLTASLLGFCFYWAYRDSDRKRKRLKIVFRILIPTTILFYTFLATFLSTRIVVLACSITGREYYGVGETAFPLEALCLIFGIPALVVWIVFGLCWWVIKSIIKARKKVEPHQ